MAEPVIIGAHSICPTCEGEGETEDGFCYLCLGTGHRISVGMNVFLKQLRDSIETSQEAQTAKLDAIESVLDDIKDRCDDIMDKCNDIFEKVSE